MLRPAHLAYYKTSAEYELLRLLDLAEVHSCTQVNLKKHEYTFGLVSPVRTFYLQAKSQVEVQEWVTALEEARQTLMATSTQNSIASPIPISNAGKRCGPPPASSPPGSHPTNHNITSSDSDDPTPLGQNVKSSSPQNPPIASSPIKSQFPPHVDPAKTIIAGYLMKCGSKRRNWRKRWFVLNSEKLMYSGSHMVKRGHVCLIFFLGLIFFFSGYKAPTNISVYRNTGRVGVRPSGESTQCHAHSDLDDISSTFVDNRRRR